MNIPLRVAFPPIGRDVWTGGHNYLGNLVRQLVRFAPEKIEPILFVYKGYAPRLMNELMNLGVTVVHDPMFSADGQKKRLARSLFTGIDHAALRFYREHRIDCLFESATYHGWRFPIPALNWMPDFQHRLLPHYFSKAGWMRREFGFRIALSASPDLMVSSQDARDDFHRFYPRLQVREHVVPFTVPASRSVVHKEPLVKKYDLPDQWFFMPNQFWQHKNHLLAVEALAKAFKVDPGITIVATGNLDDTRSKGYLESVQKRIEHHNIAKNFRILGLIPFADVEQLMFSAIAIVNPSRCEGWNTSVEEAKAMGKPMILSDIGVHREQAGSLARYFDCDDPEKLSEALIEWHNFPPSSCPPSNNATKLRRYAELFCSAVIATVGPR